jgi:hypothetical protein
LKRLPVFDHRKHASGEADFLDADPKTGRSLIIRHTGGTSRVQIKARPVSGERYTRPGSGVHFPISVSTTENHSEEGGTRLFTKRLHVRSKSQYTTKFYTLFKAPQNRPQAIALAQTVLRAIYCPKDKIKVNSNLRYVDDSGSQPVIRTAAIGKPWGSAPFEEHWTIQFTCS